MNNTPRARFDLLDGLRGVAAIAVMVYHYSQHNGLHWLSGAWAAVDLFFVLSGFVIAHSYGAKIAAGMSFVEFLSVRLVRLGPLYLLALTLGGIAALLVPTSTTQVDNHHLLTAAVLGLGWLPYFNNAIWSLGTDSVLGPIFPLNNPAWSLFFELVVNVLFFWYVRQFGRIPGAKLVMPAVGFFAVSTLGFHQLNPGWSTDNFVFGFPRVIAEFGIGAFMYSIGCYQRSYPRYAVGLLTFIAVAFFFGGGGNTALLNSVTFIPATVWMLSTLQIDGIARKICRFLGDLSYPLYILHFPIFHLCNEVISLQIVGSVAQTLIVAALSIGLSVLVLQSDFKLRRRITTAWLSTRSV